MKPSNHMEVDLKSTIVYPRAFYVEIPSFGVAEYWLQQIIPTNPEIAKDNNKLYVTFCESKQDEQTGQPKAVFAVDFIDTDVEYGLLNV